MSEIRRYSDIRGGTISKYPPYMSGHARESMNQNFAMGRITGNKPHELTYGVDVYRAGKNFNPNRELLEQSERAAIVHRVGFPEAGNPKVADGVLNTAMTGQAINLVRDGRVNFLTTYYMDPFAGIANSARRFRRDRQGVDDIVVAHKAVGSDVLNSVGNHTEDGQGAALLDHYLRGDLLYTVSDYTKRKLVHFGQEALPRQAADELEERTNVLYAPLDIEYFATPDIEGQEAFRAKYDIASSARVVSYFGRLFPEKNVDTLIKAFGVVKEHMPDAVLVIGGQGNKMEELQQLAREQRTPDIIFTGGVSEDEKRALMQTSAVGVIPTRPIEEFVETLCISAIEYEAAGTPLITTAVGGVPEAAGEHSLYVDYDNPRGIAEAIEGVLANTETQQKMATQGTLYVARFDYEDITKHMLDDVIAFSERRTSTKG